MRILLTGETGFLGQTIKKKIIQNKKYLLLSKKPGQKYILDLNNIKKINTTLKKLQPDLVINAAVHSNFKLKKSKKMMCINYIAVKKVTDYCKKNDKKLIQVSGTIVHPDLKYYNIRSKLKPKNFYGITKLLADCYILKKNLNYKIIRFGGIFGLNGPNHLFANKLVNSSKKKFIFEGDLTAKRNYINVEDAANCIYKLISHHKKGIYYCGGKTVTFKKILSIIKIAKNIVVDVKKIKSTTEIVKVSKIFNVKRFGYYL